MPGSLSLSRSRSHALSLSLVLSLSRETPDSRVTPLWALVAQYAVASTMTPLSARPYAYWYKGAQAPGVWGEKEEEEDNSKGE